MYFSWVVIALCTHFAWYTPKTFSIPVLPLSPLSPSSPHRTFSWWRRSVGAWQKFDGSFNVREDNGRETDDGEGVDKCNHCEMEAWIIFENHNFGLINHK